MDSLRQSISINQFMMVTGSTFDEAQNSLRTCNWQLESALSMFFQGQMLPVSNIRPNMEQIFAPANTPATPPNFSDALLSFAKMNTGPPVSSPKEASFNQFMDPHGNSRSNPPQLAQSKSNQENQR